METINPLISAATLLVHLVFGSYIFIFLLRFLLQKLNASWYNPISQLIIRLTEKPLKPIRKWIPGFKGFDFSIIALAAVLQIIEIILLMAIQFAVMPHFFGIVITTIAKLLSKFLTIYIYAIIINAIASWFARSKHPILDVVQLITWPVLSRLHRFIPSISGIDISPIIALLLLTFLNLLLIQPLLGLGTTLALG